MSTLLQVRQMLVKRSGRYDLVVDGEAGDWTDNGANDFINAGQKWLDRHLEYKKDASWLTKTMASGESLVTFDRARYIEQVWIATTTDGRKMLERKPYRWLRENYNDVPLSSVETGEPLYWCPAVVGLAPEQYDDDATDLTTAGVVDRDFYQYGNHYLTDGIIIMPPADGTYTVQVLARWLSKELSVDADVSFWSVSDPHLLVRAARREIEIDLHRNSQGVQDLEAGLIKDLEDIRLDLIAEEISGPHESAVMNG